MGNEVAESLADTGSTLDDPDAVAGDDPADRERVVELFPPETITVLREKPARTEDGVDGGERRRQTAPSLFNCSIFSAE